MTNHTNHLYRRAQFLKSAAKLSQLPPDVGIEVAFVGRSNVGKSSAINAITEIRHLCKTSKTPGRTQLINLFTLDEQRRLVDLPGYGYAEVPKEVKLQWQKTMAAYLEERQCLKGIILLVDIRHLLKPVDHSMLEWARVGQLPVHILLTKADKLSRQKINESTVALRKSLVDNFINAADISIQPFSVESPQSIQEARGLLDRWYEIK